MSQQLHKLVWKKVGKRHTESSAHFAIQMIHALHISTQRQQEKTDMILHTLHLLNIQQVPTETLICVNHCSQHERGEKSVWTLLSGFLNHIVDARWIARSCNETEERW